MTATQILPIPEIPDGVLEAAQLGNLVPFVGAGASRLAGCPGWLQMADAAIRQLIAAGKMSYAEADQVNGLSPRVKLSVAELIAKEHKLVIDYKSMLEPLGWRANRNGGELYGALGRLGQRFVTTNYDAWLDHSHEPPSATVREDSDQETSSPPSQRRTYSQRNDFTVSNFREPNSVIHLHGSVKDRETMVVTTTEYLAHYANDRTRDPDGENLVLTFLKHLFEEKTVLFVGYGLEDLEILEYIVQKARSPTGSAPTVSHFMLQGFFSYQTAMFETLRRYYRSCGIEMLPFSRDEKDYDQLIDVVRELARKCPAKDVAKVQDFAEMEDLLK